MIFVNHVPGNVFTMLTLREYAISDAAELFVFLAGWSLSYAAGHPAEPTSPRRTLFRLIERAVEIYRAQIAITMLALAMLAATALAWGNPLYLEWYNASAAFYDPVRAIVGLALLTYQVGYFNILPMYVVILLMAPPLVLLARASPLAGVAASFSIYAATLATGLTMPSWPTEEQWFFNPLAWQFLLVLGFAAADAQRRRPDLAARLRRLFPVAAALVAAGAGITLAGWQPDPLAVPSPRLFFLFDKAYLSPPRVVSVLALALTFCWLYEPLARSLPRLVAFSCSLGRNSLAVFCMGSLMSLAGQIARSLGTGGILGDSLIVFSGLVGMRATAWFVEWRARMAG
jgi:hypothetical protein